MSSAPFAGPVALPPAPTVVLVEGESDRVALQVLAVRWGRDLAAEGIEVVAMGGITNLRAHVRRFGPHGQGRRLAGLYDAAEDSVVRRQLADGLAGPGVGAPAPAIDRDRLVAAGFHRCDRDLEDELIRAAGVPTVEAVMRAAGEGRSLELLAQMPAQRGWSRERLLRRFLTSRSGRKARYAGLLVAALPDDRVPVPLRAVLARVGVVPP